MLKAQELNLIEQQRKAMLQRAQMAWVKYMSVGRRLDDAYHTLLYAWEDYEIARDEVDYGGDAEIRLKLAEKRHRAAQEEYQYQKAENERAMKELELVWTEHSHWHKQARRKLLMGG